MHGAHGTRGIRAANERIELSCSKTKKEWWLRTVPAIVFVTGTEQHTEKKQPKRCAAHSPRHTVARYRFDDDLVGFRQRRLMVQI